MNKIPFYAIFWLYFICTSISCQSPTQKKNNTNTLTLEYAQSKTLNFQDFYDFNQAALLQFHDATELYLSNRLEVQFSDQYIFVFDASAAQIYVFNHSGQFMHKIGNPGAGPGEYINASFFQLDLNNNTLDLLCNAGATIKTYSFSGNYLGSFNTPVICNSFAKISNNLYLFYTGYFWGPDNKRLHLGDTSQILRSFLPINTKAMDAIEPNFTAYGSTGLFRELFFPQVYKYDQNGITPLLEFRFGRREISSEKLEQVDDPFEFLEHLNRKGFCTTVSTHQGSQWLNVITSQQSSRNAQISHFFLNLQDSTYFKVVNPSKNEVVQFFFNQLRIIHIDSSDYIYFLVSPMELYEYANMHPEKFPSHWSYDPQGNPLIIKVPVP